MFYLHYFRLHSTGIVQAFIMTECLLLFPVQFSRCMFGLISASQSFGYAPAGSASRLSSCASRPSGLPHESPVFTFEVSSISIRSFKTIQCFYKVPNSSDCRLFRASQFFASGLPSASLFLFAVSVPLFSYIHSFVWMLDLGCDYPSG